MRELESIGEQGVNVTCIETNLRLLVDRHISLYSQSLRVTLGPAMVIMVQDAPMSRSFIPDGVDIG